ncbi:MAG: Ig-like domain repeat protein [Gemmatimonadota bacterium]
MASHFPSELLHFTLKTLRRFSRTLPVAFLAAAFLSCGGDNLVLPKEGEPANLTVTHGANQIGMVGTVLAESLIVRVTDPKNRPVVDARVLFTLGANASGGDVIPDTAVTDANGSARVRWMLGSIAGQQTIQARVVGFPLAATSITATATAAAANTISAVRGDGQTGTAGAPLTDSLVVRVEDQFGNAVSGTTVTWSVSGGGSVSPASVVTGANGEAAVQRVLGTGAGPQEASAAANGLTGSPVVFSHTAGAGGPIALQKILGDNNTAPAGFALADSLVIRLVDANGNGVSGRTVAWAVASGGGSVSPTSTQTDVNGYSGTQWTLGPTAGQNTVISSVAGFSVTFTATGTSDVPTKISIIGSTNNQTAAAGTSVANPPTVLVQDANNNAVPNVAVTFAVTSGGGTITPTAAVATGQNGRASLTDWTLGPIAGVNTLSATASGPAGPLAGSPLAFTATGVPGAAAQLTLTNQPPATAASGVALTTSPIVQLRDAGGNIVTQSGVNITVSLGSGTGTLNGALTHPTNSSGQATFTGLSISGQTGSFTLNFNANGLTGVTSTTITLSEGPAAKLVIVTQPPSSAQSGAAFNPQPSVQVTDAAGNPVSQSGITVTASIATGAGSLSGTATAQTSSSGVAAFSDLAITGAAGTRTLDFTAAGLTKATSNSITLGAGGATRLGFGVQPTNTVAGAAISPAVTVLVQDASGNTVVSATNAVTLALASNLAGATLGGTLTVNAVNGVATFSDLTLDKTGTGFTLSAAATGLTGATSTAFNITPSSATQLVFTQQPSDVVAGATMAPAVTVTAKDALGNTVTGYATAISLSIGTNPGGATLTGGTAVAPVNGVATFSGLSLNKAGTGYTLAASSGALNKISSTFDVSAGTATQLVFITQPGNSVAGSSIAPPVQIAIRDALGNTVTSATTSITVAIGNNPPGNGVLAGTKTVSAVNGVATFSGLSIDKPGTGYTLTANGGSLPQATSNAFNVQLGTGNKLAFVVQPSAAVVAASISPAVQVEITDAAGNRVVTANDQVTLVIGANPGGAMLSGGGPVTAVSGVATFSNLKLDKVGTSYTLTALASGLVSATSTSFDITNASTTTVITSDSPDPSVVGQGVSVQFNVNAVAPSTGNPTGGVTVTDGTVSCSASVAAGACTLTPTSTGAKTITASYLGDANFTGSTSAGVGHQVNVAATTTQVTSDNPDPSVSGQTVTVNWNVVVVAPGGIGGGLTGDVTVTDGVDSCSVPASAGTCTIALTTVGSRTLTATYAGDAGHSSSSDTENHVVGKASVTVLITSDTPDPSTAGQAVDVSFTVTSSGSGSGTPTGNVTVSDGATSCFASVAVGTCQLTLTTVGARTLTATYPGDAHFNTGSDTDAHTVSSGTTTTTITSMTPNPSVVGQAVLIQYAVSSSGGTPTGNVTVNAAGGGTCSGTVAAGQCTITFTSAGSRSITATYPGDVNFGGSTSPAVNQVVNTASTTTAITSDTPDPSTIGQAYTVNYTVSVVSPGGGTPTGNVTVSDGLDTCTGTVAAGSCSLTSSTAGSKTLVASYPGDGDYTSSSSSGTAHDVTAGAPSPGNSSLVVNNGTITASSGSSTTTITVTARDASNNPISGATVVLSASGSGNTITQPSATTNVSGVATGTLSSTGAGSKTVSATINGVGVTQTQAVTVDPAAAAAGSSTANVPSGTPGVQTTITVQAKDQFGNNVTTGGANVQVTVSGSNTAGPIAANDNGDGTYTASYTPASSGPDQVDITLNGTPILGSPFNTIVAVGPATQIQMVTGNNQSAPIGTSLGTRPTVIVRDALNNPVSGVTVSFAVTGGGGSVSPGSVATNANGLADVGWTLGPSSGTNTLTASSTGLSGSPVLFSASAMLGATATAITGQTPNPSAAGQNVSVSYAVTASVGTPTGSVTVTDGVDSCTGSVAAGTCAIALTTPGSRTLTAQYAGDANYNGSTSAGVGQTVAASATTTTISSHTPDPSITGQGITIDVSVTSGAGIPTGSVTVNDGTDTCSLTLSGGAGSCVLTPTVPGTKTLTATYAGTASFAASSGSVYHQVDAGGGVSPTLSTLTLSSGTLTASNGSSASTITVTARDALGQVISGATVVLAVAGGTGNNLQQPSGVTNGSGQAGGTFAATGSGTRTISATIDGTTIVQTQDIVVTADVLRPASSTATVPNGQVGAVTTATVQARDQFGNPLATGGASGSFIITGTNFRIGALVDQGNGVYTLQYTPTFSGGDQISFLLNLQGIQGNPYTSTVN